MGPGIGVRWTIGDVRPRGFEALRLSILGAWRIFGPRAAYAVGVHTLTTADVRRRVGPVPPAVAWIDTTRGWSRSFACDHTGPGRAEGTAWKLVPPRLFGDRFEIALDGDAILWEMPAAMSGWLADRGPRRALLAADRARAFGQMADACGREPASTAICGVPPGLDLVAAWKGVLLDQPARLSCAADVQGLQVAALSRELPPDLVGLDDVAICPPRELGRCGVRFEGLSTRAAAANALDGHWDHYRPELYRRLDAGLPLVPIAL